MSDDTMPELPVPAEDLSGLEPLVGTWRLSGGAEGTIRFEWMEGGHFLIQHVDLLQGGMHVEGLEVVGHLHLFGTEPEPEIRSRFYDSMGNTLDYVYEPIDERTIKIWGGEKGSPAYCHSTISEDGNTIRSEWVWPGGGYETTGTRVDQ